MILQNCKCCEVLKDKNGKTYCPYCEGMLAKSHPSGRKCIDCQNWFPSCKCEKEKKCSNSGGGCKGCCS